ncbi:hypothetical protein [Chitinophaga sp. MD30]|uniref:hypothetical protein n=1 Tax=Chitinophaga sp. MD30 TaxID=2033437 RepID=UPI0012FDA53D|nr:hypothetical protein [Chitinophaga sp. MD30]
MVQLSGTPTIHGLQSDPFFRTSFYRSIPAANGTVCICTFFCSGGCFLHEFDKAALRAHTHAPKRLNGKISVDRKASFEGLVSRRDTPPAEEDGVLKQQVHDATIGFEVECL